MAGSTGTTPGGRCPAQGTQEALPGTPGAPSPRGQWRLGKPGPPAADQGAGGPGPKGVP